MRREKIKKGESGGKGKTESGEKRRKKRKGTKGRGEWKREEGIPKGTSFSTLNLTSSRKVKCYGITLELSASMI